MSKWKPKFSDFCLASSKERSTRVWDDFKRPASSGKHPQDKKNADQRKTNAATAKPILARQVCAFLRVSNRRG
jgi:hypothetical protein